MTDIRFGTDGWRGIIADDVTFANVRLAARAIARRVRAEAGSAGAPHVLVGYDTRFLSREFAQAAAEAMAAEGVRVSLADRFAPTPAFSYAVVRLARGRGRGDHGQPQSAAVQRGQIQGGFGGSAPVSFTRGVEEEIRRVASELPRPRAAQPAAGSGQPAAIDVFDAREPWLDRLEQLGGYLAHRAERDPGGAGCDVRRGAGTPGRATAKGGLRGPRAARGGQPELRRTSPGADPAVHGSADRPCAGLGWTGHPRGVRLRRGQRPDRAGGRGRCHRHARTRFWRSWSGTWRAIATSRGRSSSR